MKPLKVFYNGKLLREIYPHATRWQVIKYKVRKFFRKVFIVSGASAIVYVAYLSGGLFNPQVQIVEAEQPTPAILQRISSCETHGNVKVKGTHYGKSGQVIMSPNTNGTVDVGMYQINSVWFSQATKLNLDITKPEDNQKMAEWIYANRGTGDWSSSAKCWRQ